ncbi:ABC transporter ATP-binding protein [Dactylosporangium sp. NPDC000555]|uniref:ABC transporter ATP-binding protein n=1 Tax=Dactylosporangium sp. NPDC000555 TaxID=3154260 RepID=UPI0033296A0A
MLSDVDLAVRQGEFVTLIGPSGCGKSTILNVIAGLLRARRGTVEFDGKNVNQTNTSVGYMTQGDTLLPWRTVHDNVALPLKLRNVPKAERVRRVGEALALMELTEARDKYPAQLSGGMKRRALLARSMIYQPKMLLMDEPFAALDAQLRSTMHTMLRRTVESIGQAVIFVTHDIHEAVLLSDRIVVIGGSPARPVSVLDVAFGQGRDLETLRFEPAFVALEREVHSALAAVRRTEDREGH